MKRNLILAAFATVVLGASATAAPVPSYVKAAVSDPARPEADTKRDADRKPAEMLTFAGIKPGARVMDLIPGGGYFTRIFAKAVGPTGHVYAFQPTELDHFFKDKPLSIMAVAAAMSEGSVFKFM